LLLEFKTDKMTILSKLKWVAGILLVFFVVLATNLIDRGNFKRLKNSTTTLYEDRIVASDLLFELSRLIHQKEIAVVTSDKLYFQKENRKADDEIGGLTEKFVQTKLTQNEREIYQRLKNELSNLKSLEMNYSPSDIKGKASLLKSIGEIEQYLHDLSKIQLREARQQMSISDRAMDTINLFTQVEILFLIIIAILFQIIILYKRKKADI